MPGAYRRHPGGGGVRLLGLGWRGGLRGVAEQQRDGRSETDEGVKDGETEEGRGRQAREDAHELIRALQRQIAAEQLQDGQVERSMDEPSTTTSSPGNSDPDSDVDTSTNVTPSHEQGGRRRRRRNPPHTGTPHQQHAANGNANYANTYAQHGTFRPSPDTSRPNTETEGDGYGDGDGDVDMDRRATTRPTPAICAGAAWWGSCPTRTSSSTMGRVLRTGRASASRTGSCPSSRTTSRWSPGAIEEGGMMPEGTLRGCAGAVMGANATPRSGVTDLLWAGATPMRRDSAATLTPAPARAMPRSRTSTALAPGDIAVALATATAAGTAAGATAAGGGTAREGTSVPLISQPLPSVSLRRRPKQPPLGSLHDALLSRVFTIAFPDSIPCTRRKLESFKERTYYRLPKPPFWRMVHCTQRSITSSHQSYSRFELKHTPIRVHHDIGVLAKRRSKLARRLRIADKLARTYPDLASSAYLATYAAWNGLSDVCGQSIEAGTPRFRALSPVLQVCSLRGDGLPPPLLEEEEIYEGTMD
ncbi:hypothetical protein FIBSPDRAFT_904033 [Athelia psychrophila]|uniref:Uncharacterized protein n=1 Tax=Athelia psychrophila TaxID=1759441 RepID=A0A167V952_9AGAM|nr:hypothetical protein FIBSPDRAFT_904033 [Fibularhizoctonia sp. CBS 109695]